MEFKQFTKIKLFFESILSKEQSNINTFIDLYAVDAVVHCINDGYVLNKKEEKKFIDILLANNVAQWDIEKLIVKGLPDKYIYNVLAENYPKLFENKKEENRHMPKTEQWLLQKTDSQIAINLVTNWMDNFEHVLASKKSEDIDNKIQQLKSYEHYIVLLTEHDKHQLVDFIKKTHKHSKSFLFNQSDLKNSLHGLITTIDNLQQTNNTKLSSFVDILKKLTEQNEIDIIQSLEKINEQYQVLFSEFNNMDKIKRNAVMDLYNKHLVNGLNQYLEISHKYRIKNINKKTAQSIMLENINEIKAIFEIEIQNIQEEKLMKLSSKSEYLSQLKKQW